MRLKFPLQEYIKASEEPYIVFPLPTPQVQGASRRRCVYWQNYPDQVSLFGDGLLAAFSLPLIAQILTILHSTLMTGQVNMVSQKSTYCLQPWHHF